MDSINKDPRAYLLSSPDIEAGPYKGRAFTHTESVTRMTGDSLLPRNRQFSRASFAHYTQSVYSELNRTREIAQQQSILDPDAIHIPAFEPISNINLVRMIKKRSDVDIDALFYLEDASESGSGAFKGIRWTMTSNNSLLFTTTADEETKKNPMSIYNTGANFVYSFSENEAETNSVELLLQKVQGSEKIGSVVKYSETTQEDMTVSDENDSILYKVVEDVRASTVESMIHYVILDLGGNSVGSAEVVFVDDERLVCRIVYPEGIVSQQKVLILTAFLMKATKLGVKPWAHPGPTQDVEAINTASCFFCLIGGK